MQNPYVTYQLWRAETLGSTRAEFSERCRRRGAASFDLRTTHPVELDAEIDEWWKQNRRRWEHRFHHLRIRLNEGFSRP